MEYSNLRAWLWLKHTYRPWECHVRSTPLSWKVFLDFLQEQNSSKYKEITGLVISVLKLWKCSVGILLWDGMKGSNVDILIKLGLSRQRIWTLGVLFPDKWSEMQREEGRNKICKHQNWSVSKLSCSRSSSSWHVYSNQGNSRMNVQYFIVQCSQFEKQLCLFINLDTRMYVWYKRIVISRQYLLSKP